MRSQKIAVYTAIINPNEPFGINENYDSLKKIIKEDNVDYFCFTNNKQLKSNSYNIIYLDVQHDSAVKTQRKIKILPHLFLEEKYSHSVWIDGHISIKNPIYDTALNLFNNSDFICRKHPKRNCAYNEAKIVIDIKKDNREIVEKQIKKYKSLNFPKNAGLIASGVMFRNHKSDNIIQCMETWWNELLNNSHRDQLSFNYSCWTNNTNYMTFEEEFFKKYFNQGNHRIKNGKIRKGY